MKEFTIKEITPEEQERNLRAELNEDGLFEAIKKRCDVIDDECKYMRYVQHRFIQEQLCEIMELVKMEGEDEIRD